MASNLGEFYTNLTKSANNGLNSLIKSTNSAVNSAVNSAINVVENTPQTINSLLPLTNNSKKNNSLFGLLGNNNIKTPNISTNTNITSNSGLSSAWVWPIFIFMIIAVLTIVLCVVFKDKIFTIKHSDKSTRKDVVEYGKSVGIPEEQLDFVITD